MPKEVRIGTLRWLVFLVTREQAADASPGGTGIIETLANVQQVHAAIEPLRPMTFYAARQVDGPAPTHMVTVRWCDYVDTTHAFLRQTRRPSDGAIRTEEFRIQRVMEVEGRKRFLMCECLLEDSGWTAAASPIPGAAPPVLDTNGNPANTVGAPP